MPGQPVAGQYNVEGQAQEREPSRSVKRHGEDEIDNAPSNGATTQMAEHTRESALAPDDLTKLAFERTRASYERTLMSWIKTATSLITFGFSIYKFFQIEALNHERQNRLIGPRDFALILVSIGLLSLVLATLEHRQNLRTLGAQYAGKQRSLAVLVAALISLLGILAFIAMIFRQ